MKQATGRDELNDMKWGGVIAKAQFQKSWKPPDRMVPAPRACHLNTYLGPSVQHRWRWAVPGRCCSKERARSGIGGRFWLLSEGDLSLVGSVESGMEREWQAERPGWEKAHWYSRADPAPFRNVPQRAHISWQQCVPGRGQAELKVTHRKWVTDGQDGAQGCLYYRGLVFTKHNNLPNTQEGLSEKLSPWRSS